MSSNEEPRLEGASERSDPSPESHEPASSAGPIEAAPNPIWAIVGFAILLGVFWVIDRLQGP